MTVDGKTYTWPATIHFARPVTGTVWVGGLLGLHTSDIRMSLPTQGGTVIRVKGVIQTYSYESRDVDEYAINDCSIDDEHLAKLSSGHAVTIEGFSAGAGARIYRILLGCEE